MIAEKFHTMVRRGLLNSRMRDLFGVWSLSRQFDFDRFWRRRSGRRSRGGTSRSIPAPWPLTDEFAADAAQAAQWRGFLRKSRLEGAPGALAQAVEAIATFLRPVADALYEGRPFTDRWEAPGPWSRA